MVPLAEETGSSSPSSEAVARASGLERLLRVAPLADDGIFALVVGRSPGARGNAARWRAVAVAVAVAGVGRVDHAVAIAARGAVVASFTDSRLPRSRSLERDDDVCAPPQPKRMGESQDLKS